MLVKGILNPQINSLLARVRHTNMLVIADRGFPFWPMIETVDIALVDGIPTVLQVLNAIQQNFDISEIVMAQEFLDINPPDVCASFAKAVAHIPINHMPHIDLKKLVPGAIGLIRTGDTIQYANMILISGSVVTGQKS
jgi:D-ribose pyranase